MINEIAQYKQDTGHTLHKIAYYLGYSSSHICCMIKGRSKINKLTIERLERIKRFEKEIENGIATKKDMAVFINNYNKTE